MLTAGRPVSIPRWQWRTFAQDLSWLAERASIGANVAARRVEETHLVCLPSAHHAWLAGDVLEMRWRKEISPTKLELWDTILQTAAPFGPESVARLCSAWGLPVPALRVEGVLPEELISQMTALTPSVRPVQVVRLGRTTDLDGIRCCLETILAGPSLRLDSFAIEHEDPALLDNLIAELKLGHLVNTSFLAGLKDGLGLGTSTSKERQWARKSSESTS